MAGAVRGRSTHEGRPEGGQEDEHKGKQEGGKVNRGRKIGRWEDRKEGRSRKICVEETGDGGPCRPCI